MNKKSITGKINNIYDEDESILKGIYDKKANKFYLSDQANSKIEIDINKQMISKENNDSKMNLTFQVGETTTCTYLLKDTNESLHLKVYTDCFLNDDKNLFISYKILAGEESFPFEIKMF